MPVWHMLYLVALSATALSRCYAVSSNPHNTVTYSATGVSYSLVAGVVAVHLTA